MEPTFFSSREVSAYYQTEPLIGNIALAYAFGFCQALYFNDGTIHYREHLAALNERGLYVTPATIVGEPRFSLDQFNAQADAYWYAFANMLSSRVPTGPGPRSGARPGTFTGPMAGGRRWGWRTGRSTVASVFWESATGRWATC